MVLGLTERPESRLPGRPGRPHLALAALGDTALGDTALGDTVVGEAVSGGIPPDRLVGVLGLEVGAGGVDGYKVSYEGGRACVIEITPNLTGPAETAPIVPTADLGALITEPVKLRVIRERLDEAATCREYGASVAAIVMLASALEGFSSSWRSPVTRPGSIACDQIAVGAARATSAWTF